MEKLVFTSAEAAEYLSIPLNTLKMSRYKGEIFKSVIPPKFVKRGRSVVYYKEDLDSWLACQKKYLNNAQVRLDHASN